jgi:hypothetical protein
VSALQAAVSPRKQNKTACVRVAMTPPPRPKPAHDYDVNFGGS